MVIHEKNRATVMSVNDTSPSGFKDPNNRVSGPKCYNNSGIWTLKSRCLRPWTLRESEAKGQRYELHPSLNLARIRALNPKLRMLGPRGVGLGFRVWGAWDLEFPLTK